MTPKRTTPPLDNEPEVDIAELETASERNESIPDAPELAPGTAGLTEWDTPPTAAGSNVPDASAEDEASIGQQLAEQGVDEADRDQRIAAVDPDFEP